MQWWVCENALNVESLMSNLTTGRSGEMKSCRLGGRGRRLIDLLDVVLVTDPPMTMVLMIYGRSACSATHELSARITGAWGRARPPALQLL